MTHHDVITIGIIAAIFLCCLLRRCRHPRAYVGEVIHHGTLTAGELGADQVTVYNRDTGERPQLVHSANVSEGWILQYVVHKGTHKLVFAGEEAMTRKRRGNWGLLPKEPYNPDKRRTYATLKPREKFFTCWGRPLQS